MLNPKLLNAFNNQINAELYSAYFYLSIAGYFESMNLKGFARWMRVQAQEEAGHAMKFYSYIFDRGGNVSLAAIDAPPGEFASPLAAFEDVLKHEQKVTRMIYDLVDLATAEKDHASNAFLQWFVSEQVEEEATATEVVEKLKMIGDNKNGLFMMDQVLGRRSNDSTSG
ncbi:MAG: ferritin [Candidatus Omnitrophica bacterium]|nr:ferritin [Candidatus Omnitrophota bacterium]